MSDTFDEDRERMVAAQLAARGIADGRVLEAMRRVPRHLFVDPTLRAQAYEDTPLPIGARQTISQPYMVALMSEALELADGGDHVLEVGTGSGYQTAVLAELGARVLSLERIPELADRARALLGELGYLDRVTLEIADGTLGWPAAAPYDAIIDRRGAADPAPADRAARSRGTPRPADGRGGAPGPGADPARSRRHRRGISR